MQKRFKVGIFTIMLLMTGCFTSKDEYIDIGRIEVTDAFVFDNQKNYSVGDTIFFDQKFSRYLKEKGYSDLLDVYETTNDTSFYYRFGIAKYTEFANAYISIDEQYIISSSYNGTSVEAILNANKDAYESRVGIILPASGSYKLDLDNLWFSGNSDNELNFIYLNLEHRFTEKNSFDGEFTVTE